MSEEAVRYTEATENINVVACGVAVRRQSGIFRLGL